MSWGGGPGVISTIVVVVGFFAGMHSRGDVFGRAPDSSIVVVVVEDGDDSDVVDAVAIDDLLSVFWTRRLCLLSLPVFLFFRKRKPMVVLLLVLVLVSVEVFVFVYVFGF